MHDCSYCRRFLSTMLILMSLAAFGKAFAHPGRLNQEGCHTNRKTGEYHCHKGPAQSSAHLQGTVRSRSDDSPSAFGPVEAVPASGVLKLDYDGFTVWLDCAERGAIKFRYTAQRDTGKLKRHDTFYLDPNVPAECQQKSAKAYGRRYDRGHLVPANHLDHSKAAFGKAIL